MLCFESTVIKRDSIFYNSFIIRMDGINCVLL